MGVVCVRLHSDWLSNRRNWSSWSSTVFCASKICSIRLATPACACKASTSAMTPALTFSRLLARSSSAALNVAWATFRFSLANTNSQ